VWQGAPRRAKPFTRLGSVGPAAIRYRCLKAILTRKEYELTDALFQAPLPRKHVGDRPLRRFLHPDLRLASFKRDGDRRSGGCGINKCVEGFRPRAAADSLEAPDGLPAG
jgi:hypothetical protein